MIVKSENHEGILVTGLITTTEETMALEIDTPRGPIPKVLEVHGLEVEENVYSRHEIDEEWVLRHGELYVGDARKQIDND